MPITYTQIQHILHEIAPSTISQKVISCEEIDERAFILAFPHAKLLICLRDPFLRFHLTTREGSSPSSSFIKKINENIVHTTLIKAEIINDDRILHLSFQTKNKEILSLVIEFFPRRPNAFLIDVNREILAAFRPVDMKVYSIPPKPTPPPQNPNIPLLSSKEMEALYNDKERHANFLAQKNALVQLTIKNYNRALKRRDGRRHQLEQCLDWQSLQHEGVLLQSNMYRIKRGMHEILIEDWDKEGEPRKIALDPFLTPHESIEERFKKSKKLKDGVPHLEKLIEKADKEVSEWEFCVNTIQAVSTPEDLDTFIKINGKFEAPKKKEPRQKLPEALSLPYREFHSAAGLKILVGKTAENNEELTFRYAHGNDWWLHVSGYAGSHIVIKTNHGKDPDEESILDAIQLAIAYSKAKNKGHIEVLITQRKFVTRSPRGRIGQVQVSKHKERRATLNQERLNAIKERNRYEKPIPLP